MNKEIALFNDQFRSERNLTTLKSYLDKDTDIDRFTAVVIRAVQENPDLLAADRTSLFFSCQKAAQDQLIPDGKEGFLGIYSNKIKVDGKDVWIKKVQWQPMIGGLRKILTKHGIGLRAELVCEKDLEDGRFIYEQGDTPRLIHKPNIFSDRGAVVGAYAIAFLLNTGEVIGREVMDLQELTKVRQASKNPNANVWTIWESEMQRKAPAKRLFKQLPLPDDIKEIIDRDNEQFDMNKAPAVSKIAQDVQAHVRLVKPDPGETTRYEPPQDAEDVTQEEDWPQETPVEYAGQEPDF